MTYAPRRLPTDQAAANVRDLVPWQEAARLLDVTPKTVSLWIDRGRLAYVTIDRQRLVSLTEASTVEAQTRRAGKRK